MKMKRILSLVLLTGVSCGTMAGAEYKTNEWSQPIETTLPAEGGKVRAVIQHCAQGNGRFVFVPEKQLLWIGSDLPAEHQYVCLRNAIVRIATGLDTLLIDRQEIRLQGTPEQQAETKARSVADFKRKVKDGRNFDNIQRIHLGEILFGLRGLSPFFPVPQASVHPEKPATISGVQVKGGNTIVTLTGQKYNIKVVLVLDDSMNVVKGLIGDKVCYPRGQQSKPGKK